MIKLSARPLAIAALVLKYGGSAPEAGAVLEYGDFPDPRRAPSSLAEWHTAREQELLALRADGPTLTDACAALYDAETVVHDLRYGGVTAWNRYPVPSLEVAWYFRELAKVCYASLTTSASRPLVSELAARVRTIGEVAFEGADVRHSSTR